MKLKKNIAISETGFIFNPSNGDSFSCNPLGADILNLMKEDKPLDEIKKIILKKYDVDTKVLEQDFDDFMATLKDSFLVENDK